MTAPAKFPRISIAALGGTIAMTKGSAHAGVAPTLTAGALVAGVPELEGIAEISAATLTKLPGASLTPTTVRSALEWAEKEVDRGSTGIVIAQGTDTLEETSFLAELYWRRPEPLVFTGAMRAPELPSADGPANLIAACRVASSSMFYNVGVVVVLNNEIHPATTVRKEHSTALDAFVSPSPGPLGEVIEGCVYRYRDADIVAQVSAPIAAPYVPLIESHVGDDGTTLRAVRAAGAAGVAIAALGVGHVSHSLAAEIENTVKSGVPVVVSSRAASGGTLQGTYGFEGSEIDLANRGALLTGFLDARKSRLLLWALLASGATVQEVTQRFAPLAQRQRPVEKS